MSIPSRKTLRAVLISCSTVTIILLLFMSWRKTHVANIEDFNRWLNSAENNCIKKRVINGVQISVKYQPPQYIALKDRDNNNFNGSNKTFDSIVNQQSHMLTFLMSLSPDKETPELKRAGPVMYEGVSGYSEYAQRVLSTNFFMDKNIYLYVDGIQYKPAICIVENLYELSDHRDFIVVFVENSRNDLNSGTEYIFEYSDTYFGAGKMQFDFSGNDLQSARKVKISKI